MGRYMSEETGAQRRGSTVYVVLVCAVAALGGLLFGCDTGVISDAIGPLVERFGLSAEMEGWVASCALVGCMFGAALAGTISEIVFPVPKRSNTLQARIRREKLSMTAWRYTRVPSRSRITVVSMCQISLGADARIPALGLGGCTRCRGRLQRC